MILTDAERLKFKTLLRSLYDKQQYHSQDFGYIL